MVRVLVSWGNPLSIHHSFTVKTPGYRPEILIVVIMFLCFSTVASADQEIEIARKFTGKIADPDLENARPKSGIINNPESWKELWTVWRPDKAFNEIDFSNQVVLVNTAPGPNLVFASTLKLDSNGNLSYETASSRMEGKGFGYLIMVIPSAGVKSVNGMSIDGKPVKARPKEPATPPLATPTNDPLPGGVATGRDPKPRIERPGVDPETASQEFVRVEVVGRVRTQFRSVGAETTGTLVAADGIIWELDLQDNERLIQVASDLGNSLARITGRLKMERQRGAAEARVRWIVMVESFDSLGLLPTIPAASLPNEEAITRTGDSQHDQGEPRVIPREESSNPVANAPRQDSSNQPPDDSVGEQVPARTSFNRITLVTTDGQTQSIRSDGQVHYESKSRNIVNDWTADPTSIAKLHHFVANTPWERVPRKTLSDSNDPNEISYTISIETRRSTTRIFIDRTAVPDQPVMKNLFDIIGEISRNR